ncbi:MAG: methyltransferase domain-containing protein [Spirochaetota bacterium]
MNDYLADLVRNLSIDSSFAYQPEQFLEQKIPFMASNCNRILDFGKSSRQHYAAFEKEQILTADINRFEDYPDIICDICNFSTLPKEVFDGIICMSILEHVYDPIRAVENIYALLKDKGYVLAYVPFLFKYHAPLNLYFQDFYRFSKDGIAYMFRDFTELTVYPIRGRNSTMLNLLPWWKRKIELKFGYRIDKWLDLFVWKKKSKLQVSGYYIWAQK